MRRIMLVSALLLVFCGNVFGNAGVFFGSGHTLRLVKSADVQMVSEDVTIQLIPGPTVTMHRAGFRCVFVLKNLSNKPVSIQVGFPLDRQNHLIEEDETDLVLSAHFIARDASNTYHVRHAVGNQQNRYGHIFLWDMAFTAGETKTLHVGYILPMSYAMGDTDKRIVSSDPVRRTQELLPAVSPGKADNTAGRPNSDALRSKTNRAVDGQHTGQAEEKLWRIGTTVCVVVGFSYITETGRSWAGPIEKATFRVENTVFEHCLRRYPLYVGGDAEDIPPGAATPGEGRSLVEEMDTAIFGYEVGLKLGAVYPQISPSGWKPAYVPEIPAGQPTPKSEPDGIVWRFENYKPGAPLEFTYYLLGFPEKVADCAPWVREVLGKTPTKNEVLELREILAAFYGIAPRTASLRHFVEQQVWFNPQSKGNETMLTEPRRAVLARLEAIANKPENGRPR